MGRPAPSYWWDFNRPGELPIKIETDWPGAPDPVATFSGEDSAEAAIGRAEKLMSDLVAGRVNINKLKATLRLY